MTARGFEHRAAAPRIGRRRLLTLMAATGATGLLALTTGKSSATSGRLRRWHGTALGARASLAIHHPDTGEAARLLQLALDEIERLEAIFSLYRRDSALSRLNRRGRLDAPPLDLIMLLGRANTWSERTGGTFDVTVQPLWQLYREHFAAADPNPAGPSPQAIKTVRAQVGYQGLEVDAGRIRFLRPGMAVTLNGIAQGYITDCVAELLRREGLAHVLIDLGEIRALGGHPDGRPWRVGIDGSGPRDALEVTDRAVATSATAGTRFEPSGRFHHLLDPRTGRPTRGLAGATVVARSACDADALSTALLVETPWIASAELRASGIERILAFSASGRLETIL